MLARLFKLIEGSLYRTPLRLIETLGVVDPRKSSHEKGHYDAIHGHPHNPSRAQDQQAYTASYQSAKNAVASAAGGPTYYHGTSSALGITTHIRPAAETNKQTEPRRQRRHRVFFTTNLEAARTYARRSVRQWGGEPIIHRIAPEGDVKHLSKRVWPLGPVQHATGAAVIGTHPYQTDPETQRS
jgi:hypothetical protein